MESCLSVNEEEDRIISTCRGVLFTLLRGTPLHSVIRSSVALLSHTYCEDNTQND